MAKTCRTEGGLPKYKYVVVSERLFLAEHQKKYLDLLHEAYHHLPIVEIPLFSKEIKGIERLREIEKKPLWLNGNPLKVSQ